MDEIGQWHTGALPDSVDPDHDLWGGLLARGAGVEWYFDANKPHNATLVQDYRSPPAGPWPAGWLTKAAAGCTQSRGFAGLC